MTDVFTASPRERRAALRDGLLAQFERMVEIRAIEEELNRLFAAGKVHGTTHLALGQEALVVGLAAQLRDDDHVTGTYRGHALSLALGVTPRSLVAEIMGRDAGVTGGVGGSMHLSDLDVGLLPTFAIVGAGLPVATGSALAFQTRGEDRVAVAVFGDGATNIGAFHESLNLAAVWNLPVVFLCDNNLYGEYSRIDRTTPIEDLHARAESYDMPADVVDGMDVAAVEDTLARAIQRARSGGGPTLVEAKTYRFAGHSRADTAPYRREGELEQWSERDPLTVTRRRIIEEGLADDATLARLESDIAERVTALAAEVEALPAPGVEAMFRNVWAPKEK
jgi:TPP-dependent pyruvate/acetoin dehydrogenase alpha subunit